MGQELIRRFNGLDHSIQVKLRQIFQQSVWQIHYSLCTFSELGVNDLLKIVLKAPIYSHIEPLTLI